MKILIVTYEYLQVSIHFIISFTHEAYGRATSISNIVSKFQGKYRLPDTFPIHTQAGDDDIVDHPRANATFVILCRNSDVHGAVRSVRDIEDRFNRQYRYPYVFLNDEPFTDEFKECVLIFLDNEVLMIMKAPHSADSLSNRVWPDSSRALAAARMDR